MTKGDDDDSYGEWQWLTKNINNIDSNVCKGTKVCFTLLCADYLVSNLCSDTFGTGYNKACNLEIV